MSIDSYISYLNKTTKELEGVVKKSILKNKTKILGIIRNRLYQTGVDGNGKKLRPAYSQYTILKKKNKKPKQRTSHVTLRDTGNFYKSMIIEVVGNDLVINATAYTYPLLKDKYGPDILKLSDNELNFIIDSFIEPDVNKFLNSFNGEIII